MSVLNASIIIGAKLADSFGRVVDGATGKLDALDQSTATSHAANQARRAELRGQMFDTVAMGALVAGAVGAPINAAIEFESVMADVKKVVNFDTPEQFTAMQGDILQLSTSIPMTADGIADIVAAAGQAGIAREELVRFAEDAAKMGVAFDMTGEQAGSAMTGLRSIFHLNQDEVVGLGDTYNHLSNNMDATARDMLNIANRSGSTARQFGLTGDQLGALSATFLALKTPVEVAGTSTNALFLKLATAEEQGKKFQEGLKELGFTAGGLKKSIGEDAQGTLLKFLEAVEASPDRLGVLSKMFGTEYSDDIAKLVGGLDLYRQGLELAADPERHGSMTEEFKARSETTANNIQLLKNQVNVLGVSLGTVFLPAVNMAVGGLGWFVGGMADFAAAHPEVVTGIVALVGGFASIRVASLATQYAFTFVKGGVLDTISVFGKLRKGITIASTAFKAMSTVAMANPIGLAIAGIALAAGLVWYYWEPISGFFSDLWDGVTDTFDAAWASITEWLGWDPSPVLASAWGGVESFIGDPIGTAKGWVESGIGAIGDFLGFDPKPVTSALWSGIDKVISDPIGSAKGLVDTYIGGVGLVLGFDPKPVTAALWSGLDRVIADPVGVARTAIDTSYENIMAALGWEPLPIVEAAWDSLGTYFEDLFGEIEGTIGKSIDWINSKIDIAKGAWESTKSFFGFGEEDEPSIEAVQPAGQRLLHAGPGPGPMPPPFAAHSNRPYVNNNQQYRIEVNAAPGQSAEDIADAVIRRQQELNRLEQEEVLIDAW